MDDAVRTRGAAREALADIEPEHLREALCGRLAGASMAPGVLALVTARALDPGANLDGLAERAAGVQLIYEGLRLTRQLAAAEPWIDRAAAGRSGSEEMNGRDGGDASGRADLEILAADVFVSRGFYLLARSEAATRAVETVRAFGRDQTLRREAGADGEALDRNLERDVFVLAVVAGATGVGFEASAELRAYVSELASTYTGDLPPAAALLSSETEAQIAALSEGRNDRVPSSPTDG
jgi:hypothetical protein